MTEERAKRISDHNKKIKILRRKGLLPPFGQTTKTMRIAYLQDKRANKLKKTIMEKAEKIDFDIYQKGYLTEGGSLLPNKFAHWPYPFDDITEKDL